MASRKHTILPVQLDFSFAPEEEWRAIPGYEGYYEVSNLGRVRSLTRQVRASATAKRGWQWKYGRILNQGMRRGYPRVSLHKDHEGRMFSIHHLVLLAFVGPRPPGYVCNHIDANRTNNVLQNLEWVTEHRNNQHALETGRICVGERCHKAKLTEEDVRTIRREAARGVYYIVLERRFGVSRGTIKRVVRRQSWKHLD